MEEPKKVYNEERFEFHLYMNENLIVKRYFKINNFIEGSMSTTDFKETVDNIVRMIDEDLKSKSRVYTWYYYNENDVLDEFKNELLQPWECTFKFVVLDNGVEKISKIWDGYAYPRAIRDKIDITNKIVRVTNQDGQVFIYDKEKYFSSHADRLTPEMYVLRAMISDKQDIIYPIIRLIIETCSSSKDEKRKLSNMTTKEKYGDKEYCLNIEEYNNALAKSYSKTFKKKIGSTK